MGGTVRDAHAVIGVGDSGCPIGVCADVVAGDGIAHRDAAGIHLHLYPAPIVSADEVAIAAAAAGRIVAPPDEIVARPIADDDPRPFVPQGERAAGVGSNEIPTERVVRRSFYEDTAPRIPTDEVLDDVIVMTVADRHAPFIGQFGMSGDVGADVVTDDGIVARVVDPHAGTRRWRPLLSVAADDVPLTGRVAADQVVGGPIADPHTARTVAVAIAVAVAQSGSPVDIRADVVTGDGVAHRAAAADVHPVAAVAADDVPLAGRLTADQVVAGAAIYPHTVIGEVEDLQPPDDVPVRGDVEAVAAAAHLAAVQNDARVATVNRHIALGDLRQRVV